MALELLTSLALGVGLSACCGFRVFVPLLIANVANLNGYYHFSNEFMWMGTWVAFYIFLTATILEIIAFYIPWLDNLLDAIAAPIAIIAGTVLTTSFLTTDLSPELRWILGFLVGGGSAGVVQAGTTLTRLTSSLTTAGFGNPIISTIENVLSVLLSMLSLLFPILLALLSILFIVFLMKKLYFRKSKKQV